VARMPRRERSQRQRFGTRARGPSLHGMGVGPIAAAKGLDRPPPVYIVGGLAKFRRAFFCAPDGSKKMFQRAPETPVSERYEALFRVSQTLISIRSSKELFSVLARELRAVVNFYVMGVGIYDEKAHEMRTKSLRRTG
jgi:hypothetical protein